MSFISHKARPSFWSHGKPWKHWGGQSLTPKIQSVSFYYTNLANFVAFFLDFWSGNLLLFKHFSFWSYKKPMKHWVPVKNLTLIDSGVMLICFSVDFNNQGSCMEPGKIKNITCAFLKVWLSTFWQKIERCLIPRCSPQRNKNHK